MTIRDMINNGVTLQGHVKIQCWGPLDFPDIFYEGNIEEDGFNKIEKYLDRDIKYIFPYVINIGQRNPVWHGAICIEIEEE